MAKFRFSGTIKRVTVEYIHVAEGVIDITKKNVCDEVDLPNVVDGDPTHWVDEAERFVDYGGEFKIVYVNGSQWMQESSNCTAQYIEEMEYDV